MMGAGKKRNHVSLIVGMGDSEEASVQEGEQNRHMPLLERFMSSVSNGNKEEAMASLENLVRSMVQEITMSQNDDQE